MASDHMRLAALGQPFSLGMLYDARRHELLPGLKLWDDKILQAKTTKHTQSYSAFEISASDTMESRSSLLNIDASLKASFLSGLIEVEGSAKYLNDKKKFKNQSRVTCQYNATTNFKELSVTDLITMTAQQMEVIETSTATHVVTGILYGANAFFVFESNKLDTSNAQDIQGRMEAVIKKIPSFNVEGKVDIKLTDEEKALTNKFSCKFYGDFILESNPANFEEAVKTYVKLPQLLGEDGENSVPLKVWLMPLKVFASSAAELMTDVSVKLVGKFQNVLEDLREIEMGCKDSQVDKVVENFPQIQREFRRFQNLCESYEHKLQRQSFAKKLPLIREGNEDESSLKQVLEDSDESPFSYERLIEWLNHKKREINIVRSCVDTMKGVKIVGSQSELDREVLAPGVDHALCFIFTSLKREDAGPGVMADHTDPWYHSDEVLTKMREKAEDIHNLSEALKRDHHFCFLVAGIDNKKYEGSTIYHYKKGVLVTDDFSKPVISAVREITDKSDLIWYATDLTLDPNTAGYNLILSEGNKKATYGEKQNYPYHPDRFDEIPQVLCIEGLTGRHYWEAEWSSGSDNNALISAAYKGMNRKGTFLAYFGFNDISWGFGKNPAAKATVALHKFKQFEGPLLSEARSRVGVYLDCPGGTLSFYRVSSNRLTHLFTFDNEFTEPVYPGFKAIDNGSYVYIPSNWMYT